MACLQDHSEMKKHAILKVNTLTASLRIYRT